MTAMMGGANVKAGTITIPEGGSENLEIRLSSIEATAATPRGNVKLLGQ